MPFSGPRQSSWDNKLREAAPLGHFRVRNSRLVPRKRRVVGWDKPFRPQSGIRPRPAAEHSCRTESRSSCRRSSCHNKAPAPVRGQQTGDSLAFRHISDTRCFPRHVLCEQFQKSAVCSETMQDAVTGRSDQQGFQSRVNTPWLFDTISVYMFTVIISSIILCNFHSF